MDSREVQTILEKFEVIENAASDVAYTNQLIDGADEVVDKYEKLSYTIDGVSGKTKL